MSAKKTLIITLAISLLVSSPVTSQAVSVEPPYVVAKAKESGLQKSEDHQKASGKWQTFKGIDPFVLDGDRSLFFAQLHLTCTKIPKYVKIRIARLLENGKRDTTGTTTWVLGKGTPKTWQGTTYWELKTKHPIVAQFKVGGGNCYSPERQFKWWQPSAILFL
jgi:hypothetical protein